ncbi:MAG TPA: transposase [Allosphingosinicella sp.]|nr:transposase [Allosphingosinicella sp.]
MPRLIESECDRQIELGDLVEILETGGFDPSDEESMAVFGPALRRLANNRRFLGDLVIEELKRHCSTQSERNHYSSQVILLHGVSRKFLLRANFWPAEGDGVMVNSGRDPFFYGLPHDHNFSFLTVGYLGSGYWSDHYEYDYERVAGVPGEGAELRFVERSRLSPGKVLLYRKNLDIHAQLPPDDLSVSLNILALSPASEFREQYSFDTGRSTVARVINASGLETLVRLAGHIGGGNSVELIDRFADRHPSDRIRFAAWRARADSAGEPEARIASYERAAAETSGPVSALAAAAAERLRRAGPWFEQSAAVRRRPGASARAGGHGEEARYSRTAARRPPG